MWNRLIHRVNISETFVPFLMYPIIYILYSHKLFNHVKAIVALASKGLPPIIPFFSCTCTSPAPIHPIHTAFLCHLGLSIKNVLSPESGPIKGRIPGRRADKAYLINKCFTIVGARAPRHTQPAFLWYLIIHPFHSVREGGEGRLTLVKYRCPCVCLCVCIKIRARGRTKTQRHAENPNVQRVARVNKCK